MSNDKSRGDWVFMGILLTTLGTIIFLVLWYQHDPTRHMSESQREEYSECCQRVRSVQAGDFISMDNRTYIVIKNSGDRHIQIKGPGPESNDDLLFYEINTLSPSRMVKLFEEQSVSVHKKGEDGYKEMAEWFYVQ